MTVIPAIDIRGGKVVRLTQGDFKKETVYADNPATLAKQFIEDGAKRIHVVDLEGARSGKPSEFSVVKEICADKRAQFQIGGGIRDAETIDRYLKAGASRVICGTRACLDQGFLKEVVRAFAKELIIGVDAVDGKIATHGWTKVSDKSVDPFIDSLLEQGVREIVYTDIKQDGMLKGPNMAALEHILGAFEIKVIASGGVSKLADIEKLASLKSPKLSGVIVGKAIYEGAVKLKDALRVC